MRTKTIAFLACRILAISLFGRGMQYSLFFSFIGPPVAFLGVAIFLWRQADGISTRMVRDAQEKEASAQLASRELQIVGFSIVGLVMLTTTMTSSVQFLSTVMAHPYYLTKTELAYFVVGKTVHLGIGLLLLLGSCIVVTTVNRQARSMEKE